MIILRILIPIALIILLWVIPIKYGLKWAKIKKVSKLWMLFGIHPMMGWIAYLVLRYGVEPRKICNHCQEPIKLKAKVCRYCGHQMTQEEISASISSYEENLK